MAEKFDKIYDEQADYVYSLSRRLSKTRADAEDLFQEVFLKVHRFLPSFQGKSLKGWLRQITVTTNISRYRGKKNQACAALDEHPNWKESLSDPSAGPAEKAERGERIAEVQQALQRLKADARTILVLREVEGLSYDEIADTLEITKGTVRSRLARARESLRKVLEENDG